MCGISGHFDTQSLRQFYRELATRIKNIQSCCGPDGEGLHFEPRSGIGPLLQRFRESVISPRMIDSGYFNVETLQLLVSERLNGRHDHSTAFWQLSMFDEFLRVNSEKFSDRETCLKPRIQSKRV